PLLRQCFCQRRTFQDQAPQEKGKENARACSSYTARCRACCWYGYARQWTKVAGYCSSYDILTV
ncbi:hypothetical protein KI387_024977, partial [Taxus chinensis]